jgi:hypothetical protein
MGDAVRALADQIDKARVLHGGLCHAVAMNASQQGGGEDADVRDATRSGAAT